VHAAALASAFVMTASQAVALSRSVPVTAAQAVASLVTDIAAVSVQVAYRLSHTPVVRLR
jgi:hypothetical protein